MISRLGLFSSVSSLILVLILWISACKKKNEDPNALLPAVETIEVTNITPTSATSGVIIRKFGGSDITEAGICWSTSSGPTISNNKLTVRAELGAKAITLQNLAEGETYYVRAFATNGSGTAYGNELSFKAPDSWKELTFSGLSLINSGPMAAYGDAIFVHDGPNRVFKSTDNGTTWQTYNAGLTGMTTRANMAVQQGSLILVEGNGNSYACNLDNHVWAKIAPLFVSGGGFSSQIGDIMVNNNSLFVCTVNGVLWHFPLGTGTFWTSRGNPFSLYMNGPMAAKNNTLFVSTPNGILITDNGGFSWSRPDNGINLEFIGGLVFNNNELVAGGNGKVYYSGSYGESFTVSTQGTTAKYFRYLSAEGGLLFAVSDYGILKSDATGKIWSDFSEGLPTTTVNYKLTASNGYVFVCVSTGSFTHRICRRRINSN